MLRSLPQPMRDLVNLTMNIWSVGLCSKEDQNAILRTVGGYRGNHWRLVEGSRETNPAGFSKGTSRQREEHELGDQLGTEANNSRDQRLTSVTRKVWRFSCSQTECSAATLSAKNHKNLDQYNIDASVVYIRNNKDWKLHVPQGFYSSLKTKILPQK